jgi:hypothetical protein
MTFNYTSDVIHRRGFISKEAILQLVSQEEIFSLVLNYIPKEFDYVVSPLRIDKSPGCWFSYHTNGILYFIDFGHTRTHSDCFNLVQDYFKIPNFYLTLEYIYATLIQGKDRLPSIVVKEDTVRTEKKRVKLIIEARAFNLLDKGFYTPYGITKPNLIEDKVFPTSKLYLLNTKTGSHVINCDPFTYTYTEFADSRKKVYFPKKTGSKRFLTNCTKDDIGGIHLLPMYGQELIITKGYKDYRVLKNMGKNVVWFQNEGMIPNDLILYSLVRHFVNVIVWFDNDQAGIIASEKIKQKINSMFPGKAKNLWLPERGLEFGVKDPSDCRAKEPQYFQHFIKQFTL